MFVAHAKVGIAPVRANCIDASGRFHPDQPIVGRRDPDRARAVGGMGGGNHAAGDGCCCTATGATCAQIRVPGITGFPPGLAFRGDGQAKFRRGSAAQQPKSSRAQAGHRVVESNPMSVPRNISLPLDSGMPLAGACRSFSR